MARARLAVSRESPRVSPCALCVHHMQQRPYSATGLGSISGFICIMYVISHLRARRGRGTSERQTGEVKQVGVGAAPRESQERWQNTAEPICGTALEFGRDPRAPRAREHGSRIACALGSSRSPKARAQMRTEPSTQRVRGAAAGFSARQRLAARRLRLRSIRRRHRHRAKCSGARGASDGAESQTSRRESLPTVPRGS